MESVFEELILQTEDEATVQEATNQIQELLQNPDAIPALINLFTQSNQSRVRTACLAFLHKIIDENWTSFSEEAKSDLKDLVLSLFSEEMEPKHIQMICLMAGTIYSKDSGQWDQLISVILDNWESHPLIASQLLVSVIDDFSWENNNDSEDFAQRFLAMDSFFITNPDTQIHIAGLRILSSIMGSIIGYDDFPNFVNMANKIAANSVSSDYTGDDFTSIWNSISAIITTLETTENEEDASNQEDSTFLNELTQTAIQVASNTEIESNLRVLPTTAIVNEISSHKSIVDYTLIETALELIIDVIAKSIEETKSLPFDLLSLVSSLFSAQPPRGEIYEIISSKLFEALNSESISHQASGLLILRVLLVDAPDCSHNDAPKIADLIMKAILSEDSLLVQSAASVISVFDETFKSMNVFSAELLKAIIPYIVHPQVEVRHHCLEATLIISEILDTEIPDFFKSVWELYKESSPDDLALFFTLIAISIKYTPEFDDDDVATVTELLKKVFSEKEDLTIFSSSLTIVHALISFDSQLSEELLPEVIPNITLCLEFENSDVLNSTVHFLSDCITFFKDAGIDVVIPFVPQLLNFISTPSNEILTDNIRTESLITLSRFVKHGFISENEEFDYNSLIQQLLELVNNFVDSNSAELEKGASLSIRALAPVIDDEIRLSFLDKLIQQVESHFDISVIQEAIRSIARLLKVTEGSNEKMTEESVMILTKIIEGKVDFLQETPLIEIDTAVSLFGSVCKLITAIISVNSPITDEICSFLLQFIKRDSDIDKSVAVEALSDAIFYNATSQEICESIVQSVADLMQNAEDPGLQENIIYLFNVCIIMQQQLIPSIMGIMELFVNWWKNALDNQSGYSDVIDNLSSLFLGLAIACDDFPQDLLLQVFKLFPRLDKDSSTTANMCRNIVSYVDNRKDVIEIELFKEIALALARVFMLDKLRLIEMQIDTGLQKDLQTILITILKMKPELMSDLEQLCENSKIKARRLESIINSV